MSAVKGLADPAHVGGNRQIADPHFAKISVHIAAEQIKNPLSDCADRGRLGPQPIEQDDDMQHNHLETPVDCVGHTKGLVKSWRARLCHDDAIEGGDNATLRGTTKQTEYHWVRAHYPV